MDGTRLKDYPADAVMIVAAFPQTAIRENMESVHPEYCRDCGRPIVYSGRVYRRALAMPERRGRPIKFFCVECFAQYDVAQVAHFEDHRGQTPESTCVLVRGPGGLTGIRCLVCGRTSWNPNDVRARYCGSCHAFHPIGPTRTADRSHP